MTTTITDVKQIVWTGASGVQYKYWIYPLSTTFKASPGNYAFSKETKPGYWSPLYFGQTKDLSERFDNHHKLDFAIRCGATHIHVHVNNSGESMRLNEESDLIKKWNPHCNG